MKNLTPILKPVTNPTDIAIVEQCDQSVRFRRIVELGLVRNLIQALQDAGYEVKADNGEDDIVDATDIDLMVKTIFACDECRLRVRRLGTEVRSFVFLVFGNSGWDAISDYGTALEQVIAPFFEWLEKQETLVS